MKILKTIILILTLVIFKIGFCQDSSDQNKYKSDTLKSDKGEIKSIIDYRNGEEIYKETNEYYNHIKNLLYTKEIKINNKISEKRAYSFQDNAKYILKTYHSNGKLNATGKIDDELKEGKWNYYDDKGKLINTEKYKNGLTKNDKLFDAVIVLKNQDSLHVKVKKIESTKHALTKIRFWEGSIRKIYYASQIKALLTQNKKFQSVKLDKLPNLTYPNTILLEAIITGKLQLYKIIANRVGINPNPYGSEIRRMVFYYIKKENSNIAIQAVRKNISSISTVITTHPNKKEIIDYLKDRPDIIEKINSKEFKLKNDITEIVKLYNSQ
ncbi:hypothetical protein N9344_00205 [bacterium]|nr:hypothetical protein [bacterium]